MRGFAVLLTCAATMLACSLASAEPIVLDTAAATPGTYVLTIDASGSIKIERAKVVAVTGNPTNPLPPVDPPPPGPNPTDIETVIERMTRDTLEAGGTKTTAAAISSLYRLVGDGVANGSIEWQRSLDAIRVGTDTILAGQPDKDWWGPWRKNVGEALQRLTNDGSLAGKEKYAATLREIAGGINRATGFTPQVRELLAKPKDALGILEGVDLVKLIELIKLVMELIKLFQPPM